MKTPIYKPPFRLVRECGADWAVMDARGAIVCSGLTLEEAEEGLENLIEKDLDKHLPDC